MCHGQPWFPVNPQPDTIGGFILFIMAGCGIYCMRGRYFIHQYMPISLFVVEFYSNIVCSVTDPGSPSWFWQGYWACNVIFHRILIIIQKKKHNSDIDMSCLMTWGMICLINGILDMVMMLDRIRKVGSQHTVILQDATTGEKKHLPKAEPMFDGKRPFHTNLIPALYLCGPVAEVLVKCHSLHR